MTFPFYCVFEGGGKRGWGIGADFCTNWLNFIEKFANEDFLLYLCRRNFLIMNYDKRAGMTRTRGAVGKMS